MDFEDDDDKLLRESTEQHICSKNRLNDEHPLTERIPHA